MNNSFPPPFILQAIQGQAQQKPESTAVSFQGKTLSYKELDKQSRKFAEELIVQGIGGGDLIALHMERCIELAVFLLGILRVGAAYVPLDPSYPRNRLEIMLADSGAKLVVSDVQPAFEVGDCKVLCIDQVPLNHAGEFTGWGNKQSLGYVIYTSGSTGRPKGVSMPLRALDNLVEWQIAQSGFDNPAKVLQFTPISFDVHFQEFFCTWATGGELVLINDNVRRDASALVDYIIEHDINRLYLPFVGLQQLADASIGFNKVPVSLKQVITAGEQLVCSDTVRAFFSQLSGCHLYNQYGPSESHVVTSYQLDRNSAHWPALPPIGYVLPNVEVLLLNENLLPVSENEPGELYIAGICLAEGYRNLPDITAERFIEKNIQGKAKRLYKTGDIAKQDVNGCIQYLGRVDSQVKIRGHRVETGEIENVLCSKQHVKESAVQAIKRSDGDQRLVAYLVLDESCYDEDDNALLEAKQQWGAVWDSAYKHKQQAFDEGFDYSGWQNSFDGQLFSKQAISAWVNDKYDFIKHYQPKSVLEVKCGLGLLTQKLALDCAHYIAIDESETAVQQLKASLASGSQYSPIEVHQVALEDLAKAQFSVDTIIFNAACSYLVSEKNLIEQIKKAVDLIGEKGRIIFTDVISQDAKRWLQTEVELSKASPQDPIALIKEKVLKAEIEDPELLIDPGYFSLLPMRFTGIQGVGLRIKSQGEDNELTRYRYDVVLEISDHDEDNELQCAVCDWQDYVNISPDSVEQGELKVLNVPNSHLVKKKKIYDQIMRGEVGTVGELDFGEELNSISPSEIVKEWGGRFDVNLSPSDKGVEYFDIVIGRRGTRVSDSGAQLQYNAACSPRLISHPLKYTVFPKIVNQLQAGLAQELPEYMRPDQYCLITAMPVTPSGKVDRGALPMPSRDRPPLNAEYQEPTNEIEAKLVKLWERLLDIENIGVNDSFFDLGGNSILSLKLAVELRKLLAIEELPVAKLFQYPTIKSLANHFQDDSCGSSVQDTAKERAQKQKKALRNKRFGKRPVPK